MGQYTTQIQQAGKKLRELAEEWKKTVNAALPYGDVSKLYIFIKKFRDEKKSIGLSFNKAQLKDLEPELVTARNHYISNGLLYEEYKAGSKVKTISLAEKASA